MAWRLGRERGQAVTSLANLSSAGLAFGMAVILGAALGYGVDRLLGSSPIGFLIGFLLGLIAGMFNVFRAAGVWGRSGAERMEGPMDDGAKDERRVRP